MAARKLVTIRSRKEQMARALALLVIGVGVLLAGLGWFFQQTPIDNSYPRVSEQVAETPPTTLTDAPAQPPVEAAPAAMPPLDTSKLSLKDKPAPETPPVIQETPASTEAAKPEATPAEPAPVKAAQPEPTAPPAEETAKPAETSQPETPPPAQEAKTDTTADTKPPATETTQQDGAGKTGWIYGGQFSDGKWLERGLVIGEELPVSGQNYTLNWGANIRSQPPGKGTALSETVGYLPQGGTVQILQVRKSGSKGHIWLEVKR